MNRPRTTEGAFQGKAQYGRQCITSVQTLGWFLAIFLFWGGMGVKGQPNIQFYQQKVDLGLVPDTSAAPFEFLYSNTGTAPLRILKVDCHPHISEVRFDSLVLPGGNQGYIRGHFKPSAVRFGSQVLVVTTNDPGHPVFDLSVRLKSFPVGDDLQIMEVDASSIGRQYIQQLTGPILEGGGDGRVAFSPEGEGPLVYKVQYQGVGEFELQLKGLNDVKGNRFGAFFIELTPLPASVEQISERWNQGCFEHHLFRGSGSVLLVLYDLEWLLPRLPTDGQGLKVLSMGMQEISNHPRVPPTDMEILLEREVDGRR